MLARPLGATDDKGRRPDQGIGLAIAAELRDGMAVPINFERSGAGDPSYVLMPPHACTSCHTIAPKRRPRAGCRERPNCKTPARLAAACEYPANGERGRRSISGPARVGYQKQSSVWLDRRKKAAKLGRVEITYHSAEPRHARPGKSSIKSLPRPNRFPRLVVQLPPTATKP